MRIRVLPLPAERFVLVIDRLENVTSDVSLRASMFESLRESCGAASVIASHDDIDLDESALTLPTDTVAWLSAAAHA